MTKRPSDPTGFDRNELEASIRACYESWSSRYYEDYYRAQAAYPPVHVDIVKRLIQQNGIRSLLDAGCGPASMLRDLAELGTGRWGFDLTPRMVAEAQRVLAAQGVPAHQIWQGSVLDQQAFRPPGGAADQAFDAVLCFGVLPHIPESADEIVLAHVGGAVRPGGIVAIEARNQLFALFTLNRYSRDFFHQVLIDVDELRRGAGDERAALDRALERLDGQFRTDLPTVRKGTGSMPGYDEVLSRTHNPFVLRQQAEASGLIDVQVLFYHFHALPPMLEAELPALFRRASVALENPKDWRGHFMASAFVLVGRRPDQR